jgi:hypothetical protein
MSGIHAFRTTALVTLPMAFAPAIALQIDDKPEGRRLAAMTGGSLAGMAGVLAGMSLLSRTVVTGHFVIGPVTRTLAGISAGLAVGTGAGIVTGLHLARDSK